MSLVQNNLMEREGYSPYCGNMGEKCPTAPRTEFNGEQFTCDRCGWVSQFEADFIEKYKSKWKLT